jgi:TolB protein
MTLLPRAPTAWIVAQVAVLALAACTPAPRTNPATTTANPTTSAAETAAPMVSQAALFYTKAGSLYVSDPAGTPGRKLTDGPADTEPAPSPDLAHVAYVHKANASDYGGELWVLDLSPQRAPVGAPRRLVDPAALPPEFGGAPTRIVSPRWSPAGKQVAFLESGEGGGLLLVAAADTGTVVPTQQPMFADDEYAWAPDGRHIAWTGGRSDVSPVDVNVLAVGGASAPVAKDTDAFSVTYGNGGQAILFANGDASGEAFAGIPFAIRDGGIYSVATPGGAPANPPAPPTSLFAGQASYGDVAALASGAVAFTERSADGSAKSIQVLDAGSSLPRTKIANVAADGPGPAWGAGDIVAYLDTSPGKPLIVTDVENRTPRQVDTGADAFAWPPQTNSTTSGGKTVPK